MGSENPSSLRLHLPEEITEEILSRLPVKSMLRFRCVSKSWLSLVESNRFIQIHYQNSSKNTSLAHHRLITNYGCGDFCCYSLQSLLNSNSKKRSSTEKDIDEDEDEDEDEGLPRDKNIGGAVTLAMGCCNGVLCLLSMFPDNLWLWNPATKVVVDLRLSQLPGGISSWKFGFGRDESTGAFKVFATTKVDDQSNKSISHVYSSQTNSWKTLPSPGLVGETYDSLFNYFGVFACGRLHWAMQLRHEPYHVIIDSFNLESDEFERIETPFNTNANAMEGAGECYDPGAAWLGEIGGCLCTMFHDLKKERIDVWVMKEYGVKDSWFIRLSFPFPLPLDGVRRRLSLGDVPGLFSPVLFEDLNGEILITFMYRMMVYSPKDDVFSKVADYEYPCPGFVYVESLVSPLTITRS